MIQTRQNERHYAGVRIQVNARIRRAIRNHMGNLTRAEYASAIDISKTKLDNILARAQTLSLVDYRRIFGGLLSQS